MALSVESIIGLLRTLDIEEQKLKASRVRFVRIVEDLDEQLEKIAFRRTQLINDVEAAYKKKISSLQQTLSPNDGKNVKSTDGDTDADAFTQKRKTISRDASNSDFEVKKAKCDIKAQNATQKDVDLATCLKTNEVIHIDTDKDSQKIDDIADKAIKEFSNPDNKLKKALEELSTEADFKSLVEDVEIDSLFNYTLSDLDTDSIADLNSLNEQISPISTLLSNTSLYNKSGDNASLNKRLGDIPEPSKIPRPILDNFVSKLMNIKTRINSPERSKSQSSIRSSPKQTSRRNSPERSKSQASIRMSPKQLSRKSSPERSRSQTSIRLTPEQSPVPRTVVAEKVRRHSKSNSSTDKPIDKSTDKMPNATDEKKKKNSLSPPVDIKSKCFKELASLWEQRVTDDEKAKKRGRGKPRMKNGETLKYSDF